MRQMFSKEIDAQIKHFGGAINIRLFIATNAGRNIYGENTNKVYTAPISVPALIQMNPSEEIVTEAGMDKERTELIAKISREALQRTGLITTAGVLRVTTDDLLVLNGVTYAITKITPFVHFNNHLLFAIGAIRT